MKTEKELKKKKRQIWTNFLSFFMYRFLDDVAFQLAIHLTKRNMFLCPFCFVSHARRRKKKKIKQINKRALKRVKKEVNERIRKT